MGSYWESFKHWYFEEKDDLDDQALDYIRANENLKYGEDVLRPQWNRAKNITNEWR